MADTKKTEDKFAEIREEAARNAAQDEANRVLGETKAPVKPAESK